MEKYLFILSTKAGSYTNKLEKLIHKYCQRQKISSYKIKKSRYKHHPCEIAEAFAKEHGKKGRIFVSGGDGTINEVANVLVHYDSAMGVLPTGTANDFSKSLYGRKVSIEYVLSSLDKMFVAPIDLIKMDLKGVKEEKHLFCINIASFGFDTVVLGETYEILERFPFLSKNAYFIGVLKALPRKETVRTTVELDDGKGKKKNKLMVLLGSLANGQYYGNGFQANPLGKLDDGYVHLSLIKDQKNYEIPRLALKYRHGDHLNLKGVYYQATKSGFLSFYRPTLVNLDGEIDEVLEIKWKVKEKSLPFLHISSENLVEKKK